MNQWIISFAVCFLSLLPLCGPVWADVEATAALPAKTKQRLDLVFRALPQKPETLSYVKGYFASTDFSRRDREVVSRFASLYLCSPLVYIGDNSDPEAATEEETPSKEVEITQKINALDLDAIVHVGFACKNVFPFFKMLRDIPDGIELDFYFCNDKQALSELLEYYEPLAKNVDRSGSIPILEFRPKTQLDYSEGFGMFQSPKEWSEEDKKRIGETFKANDEAKKLFVTRHEEMLILCTDKDILTETLVGIREPRETDDVPRSFEQWFGAITVDFPIPIDFRSNFWAFRIYDKAKHSETDFYSAFLVDENALFACAYEKLPEDNEDTVVAEMHIFSAKAPVQKETITLGLQVKNTEEPEGEKTLKYLEYEEEDSDPPRADDDPGDDMFAAVLGSVQILRCLGM